MNRRFLMASWACFLSAALGLAFLPSFFSSETRFLQIGIPIVSVALYIYFMSAFRALLSERLGFAKANLVITLLIVGMTGVAVSSILDEISLALVPVSIVLAPASLIVVGVSSVILGLVLLMRLTREFRWMGIALGIFLIFQGLFFTSIVWVAFGIEMAVLADLALGLVFRRFSRISAA